MTELSAVSYCIAKADLAMIFAKAADFSHRIEPPDHELVMDIDRALEQIHDNIPPALQWVSMNQSFLDPPALIYNRFKLEMLYQKTRCVLHRRSLTEGSLLSPSASPRGDYSRATCVDAAMTLLGHHAAVFDASQDATQLNSTRWFMSSLNAHDFLLAAMIICLELHLVSKNALPAGSGKGRADERLAGEELPYLQEVDGMGSRNRAGRSRRWRLCWRKSAICRKSLRRLI